jgi:hypothetical protein
MRELEDWALWPRASGRRNSAFSAEISGIGATRAGKSAVNQHFCVARLCGKCNGVGRKASKTAKNGGF